MGGLFVISWGFLLVGVPDGVVLHVGPGYSAFLYWRWARPKRSEWNAWVKEGDEPSPEIEQVQESPNGRTEPLSLPLRLNNVQGGRFT
jgi:hypothetical protein